MNIKITDSWLREHLKTRATERQIAQHLSLSSVSIEKIEKIKDEIVYEVEVTSNRVDLMSVIGIAKETATVLSHAGFNAEFIPLDVKEIKNINSTFPIEIKNDPKIVNRVCAVVMEVELKDSPEYIKERLEAVGIRSLNNLIDVTNYVMRETGHPTHVFDFDRLNTDTLIIRESKKGEIIKTLDKNQHILQGGDIVADNGKGEIVDLLGVMGTENSVVTENTKRILFFIDNTEPHHIRKTSMSLGIRTEAAIINEKGVDPNKAMETLLYGIKLYEQIANGKVISKIFDTYPNKVVEKTVKVTQEKINSIIGVEITTKKSKEILDNLGLKTKIDKDNLIVTIPTERVGDIEIEEDIIEEIARVYGYHKIPNLLPPLNEVEVTKEEPVFYFENRVKQAFKYWGFSESYTYSFVSEDLLEGPKEEAVEISNPLSKDTTYMRKTLVPSLLNIERENKARDEIKVFEIANVYEKRVKDLPKETLSLAAIIKKPNLSFFEGKGIIEQLLADLGIKNISFKPSEKGGLGASVLIDKQHVGEIEMLRPDLLDFELDFEKIVKHASLKKVFKPFLKFPPVFEDLAIIADESVLTTDIINTIKEVNSLIVDVYLLDQYQDSRTFHVVYQSNEKNLTSTDVKEIREEILSVLEKKLNAKLKN